MAYIKVHKQSDGSTRYTAIVRLRRDKTMVHQEARTFAHRVAASTRAKHREVVLEDRSALARVQHGTPTLAELIRWYSDTFETISKWQRSKQDALEISCGGAATSRHALYMTQTTGRLSKPFAHDSDGGGSPRRATRCRRRHQLCSRSRKESAARASRGIPRSGCGCLHRGHGDAAI